MFIEIRVINFRGEEECITINIDHIRLIKPDGSHTRIEFDNSHFININIDYSKFISMLKSKSILHS